MGRDVHGDGRLYSMSGFLAGFLLLELFMPYRLARWRAGAAGRRET